MIKPEIVRSVFLVGPTASGKSEVGLCLAEMAGAEIISLDSMTLWREMDIGTAKPTPAERARVRHHLIDVLDPAESFNAARYAELAAAAAGDIQARGRVALFVGGTGLYLRALVAGLFEGPQADWPLRDTLKNFAAEHGTRALHERLRSVDPAAAERIHQNDLRRIVRALEVFEKTGKPITELQQQWRPRADQWPPVICLELDRHDLYERIDRRVDAMMAAGFLAEVQRLLQRPRGVGQEAAQALGYKELIAHLRGEIALDDAVELIKRNTRRFAKRQMTWFRSIPQVRWFAIRAGQPAAEIARGICGEVPFA